MKYNKGKIVNIGLKMVLAAALCGLSAFLLKSDVWTFWTWWILAALMGMIAMPLTGVLFAGFDDKGWVFSKILAIMVTGFLTWWLVSVKILKFTAGTCIGVSIACGIGCFFLFHWQMKRGIECLPVEHVSLIYWEEVIFFAAFLLWTYLAGFKPAAYGTEKFMDYGFMEALMRSTELPALDMWYSQGHLNYYYGGQYFAVFLTKLSGASVSITYNLMRMFVAGLAFVMPFSLVYQMTKDRFGKSISRRKKNVIAGISGLVAGFAVSIAGNMHYVIYAKIIPFIQKLTGSEEISGYWFPDATRYIGFDPDVPDKTIHEFPCYSFVLGDLHAHVVNIMFVIFLVGILYAWLKIMQDRREHMVEKQGWDFWKEQIGMPHILLVSVLLGMFQWTNFWDFVIYFVVTGGTVLFMNIIYLKGKPSKIFAVTAVQAAEVLLISYVVILPFTLQFETMVQGVALAKYHSLPHQLLVLWGLPAILVILFLVMLAIEKIRGMEEKNPYGFLKSLEIPDLFAMVTGLCALGLVLIPELVYVRDIYENGNARANTMFKLTYQAYIMFGITMGYVIFRLLFINRQKVVQVLAGFGLVCLIFTGGYFGNSTHAWFGNYLDRSQYKGLNATSYIETDFPEDAAAIRWLRKNITGSPVVLEANGDSYSSYCRVSAMTGLPTVLGWYVHEWLWRNNTGDLNEKIDEIATIYTSEDAALVNAYLLKYDIEYIFVGAREKEKYGEGLNDSFLRNLGSVVFEDETSGTYIVEIQ